MCSLLPQKMLPSSPQPEPPKHKARASSDELSHARTAPQQPRPLTSADIKAKADRLRRSATRVSSPAGMRRAPPRVALSVQPVGASLVDAIGAGRSGLGSSRSASMGSAYRRGHTTVIDASSSSSSSSSNSSNIGGRSAGLSKGAGALQSDGRGRPAVRDRVSEIERTTMILRDRRSTAAAAHSPTTAGAGGGAGVAGVAGVSSPYRQGGASGYGSSSGGAPLPLANRQLSEHAVALQRRREQLRGGAAASAAAAAAGAHARTWGGVESRMSGGVESRLSSATAHYAYRETAATAKQQQPPPQQQQVLTSESIRANLRSSWASNHSHQSAASVQSSAAWGEGYMGSTADHMQNWEPDSPRSVSSAATNEPIDGSVAMTPRFRASVTASGGGRALTLSSLRTDREGAAQQVQSPFAAAGAVAAAALPAPAPPAPAQTAKAPAPAPPQPPGGGEARRSN
jgi:hypothetical protein